MSGDDDGRKAKRKGPLTSDATAFSWKRAAAAKEKGLYPALCIETVQSSDMEFAVQQTTLSAAGMLPVASSYLPTALRSMIKVFCSIKYKKLSRDLVPSALTFGRRCCAVCL